MKGAVPIGIVVACFGLLSCLAWAEPITITNAGFEIPVNPEDPLYGDGTWEWGVYAWEWNEGVGTGNPAFDWFPGWNGMAREHRNISGSNSGYLQQTLSATLQTGMNYTLMVEIGYRENVTGFPGYLVELLAGDTTLDSDSSYTGPAEGEWLTSTVKYWAPPRDLHAGENLRIRLSALESYAQVNFDNVRLDARPVSYQPLGPLHISNPGFEATDLVYGEVDNYGIVDWDFIYVTGGGQNNGTGVQYATPSMFPGGAPEGENIAFSNGLGHIIRQILPGEELAANIDEYVLTVEVGNRDDIPGFPGYTVQLMAFDPDTSSSEMLAEDVNPSGPGEGEWLTSIVRYPIPPESPRADQYLEIRLIGNGLQVCFDDVHLYALDGGDYDDDGDVDLDDFVSFAGCMTGPHAGPVGAGCEVFDFEPDDDVDLQDFGQFQNAFTGEIGNS
ncbi:MAG: hypothetical protein KAY37_03505 [Phycisphaerae bacterium]|nr:hypothetical protein [Phycisphaerae bacterium]